MVAYLACEFWERFHGCGKQPRQELIPGTKVNDDDDGQDAVMRLADAIAANSIIARLYLEHTNLIGSKNVDHRGDTIIENTTMTRLLLTGYEDEIVNELKQKLEQRIPELNIRTYHKYSITDILTIINHYAIL